MSNMAKVGIFMALALAVLGYLIFKIEDLDLWGKTGQRVEADFESVAGLDDKAAVRVAGVRVGRVDGIRLVEQRAVVGLLLDPPITLTTGTSAKISSLGLLGDKFVELELGPPGAPTLSPDATLPGEAPVGWDEAVAQISELGTTIQRSMTAIDPETTGETLRRLLVNLDRTSASVRDLVIANRANLDSTASNFESLSGSLATELPKLTAQIERVLVQVEAVVTENRGALSESLGHIEEASGSMRSSLADLSSITSAIADGEGTLGKLVASDEAHDQLTSTLGAMEAGIDSLSETFGKISGLGLDLSLDGYVLDETDETRTAFSITIDPRDNSRFYRLGVVDDPRGRLRTRTETIAVTTDGGLTSTTETTTRTIDDDFTFSAQFGFRLGSHHLRAGFFESTGGLAVDYGLLDERLWMSVEAFDFGREDDLDPHFRLLGKWQVHPNVYLLGGLDDFLESDRETYFLGAGVRWRDDDLKYLLGSIPTRF